eukprot:scaffold3158_cov389-Prasinococcus_capsulatus_cf.AAC.18
MKWSTFSSFLDGRGMLASAAKCFHTVAGSPRPCATSLLCLVVTAAVIDAVDVLRAGGARRAGLTGCKVSVAAER